MMIEGQEPTGAVAIRPCRAEECEAVLALWRRAGAIPSPTDTLEELLRLVRSEHGDGFLVAVEEGDRKSTRLNSSHVAISYAVFCLKKKKLVPQHCSATARRRIHA